MAVERPRSMWRTLPLAAVLLPRGLAGGARQPPSGLETRVFITVAGAEER
jgi:hypothetical protein